MSGRGPQFTATEVGREKKKKRRKKMMVFDSMQVEVYPCPKAPRRGEGPWDKANGGNVRVVFCLKAVSSSWSLECKRLSHSLYRLSG